MTETPAQQLTAITKKAAAAVTPDTKVAIPLLLVAGVAWWVIDYVRQRDLDRLALERDAIRTELSHAKETAVAAKALADGLVIRLATAEADARHTGAALQEMKTDIRGILVEIRQMRQEARP